MIQKISKEFKKLWRDSSELEGNHQIVAELKKIQPMSNLNESASFRMNFNPFQSVSNNFNPKYSPNTRFIRDSNPN